MINQNKHVLSGALLLCLCSQLVAPRAAASPTRARRRSLEPRSPSPTGRPISRAAWRPLSPAVTAFPPSPEGHTTSQISKEGFQTFTAVTGTGREGVDERVFRFGLHQLLTQSITLTSRTRYNSE